ncbi:MAG: hypothetical protein GF346_03950 [Candidatus Eisenbacteria bacterium]|nr:hypothetical protein [Candidatus Latescibacterota bacterium]MBD3301578.1 hypothetical protein [Candidatus Eisenbacteria bacterium]
MKGLYLNVPRAEEEARAIDAALGAPSAIAAARHGTHRIVVDHHPRDWPEGPIWSSEDGRFTAAASGWLLFEGRIGDLRGIARAYRSAESRAERVAVLRGITAGAFLLLLLDGERVVFVTDPFGLHPHYRNRRSAVARIAPSAALVREEEPEVAALAIALDRQDHLFGNRTVYESIHRLEPGAIIEGETTHPWFDYGPREDAPDPLEAFRDSLKRFAGRGRILPITGGLDSRLMLACGDFEYGYTFGPPDTGDRPIARRFRDRFTEYDGFSLLDLQHPRDSDLIRERIFGGICARPFLELIPVFRRVAERWGSGCWFFDGFGGDVLQRGLYLTSGGVDGGLAKLLPFLTTARFDPIRLLRKRYPGLGGESADLLVDTYREKSAAWSLDEPRKLVLFELLHGRGARYVINGGTILSGQFFSTAQPFLIPSVFHSFWREDPFDALSYRLLPELWRRVDPALGEVPTYSGFRPTWNHHRARVTMLVVKGLGKAGLSSRSVGYEREVARIRERARVARRAIGGGSNR